jgi:hypothetical protein
VNHVSLTLSLNDQHTKRHGMSSYLLLLLTVMIIALNMSWWSLAVCPQSISAGTLAWLPGFNSLPP